jgi:photosystem II stability/assembly factor-like uncharacterized protein
MKTPITLLFVFLLPCFVANAQWIQTNGPAGGNMGYFIRSDTTFYSIKDSAGIGISLLRSTNNGASWTDLNPLLSKPQIEYVVASDQNIFVETFGSAIYRSTNYGNSWMKMSDGFTTDLVNSFSEFWGYLFAGLNYDGIYRSADGGATWVEIDTGLFKHNGYAGHFASSGTYLFVATSSGVYRSIDSGTTWIQVNTGITDLTSGPIAVSGTSLLVNGGQAGIFRSTDNGNHWVQTDLDHITHSIVVSGSDVFAGSEDGIYHSKNNGINWTSIDSGLSPNSLGSGLGLYTVFRDTLFAGYEKEYWWELLLSKVITSSVPASNQPSAIHLEQNYPNPFSGSTTIRFDIPERAAVSLKVYDITGREVAVLASETMDAGSYTRTFNAEGLPSGMYICQLEAGSSRQAKTLQVIR